MTDRVDFRLRDLARIVASDVNRTVGGGYAGIELLRRSTFARGWLDAGTHGVLTAVSRLTPGTNVIAYCVALGWHLQRLQGSVTAVAAASIPSALIIWVASATLVRVDRYTPVRVLLAAGALVAAILVFMSAWSLLRPYLSTARTRAAVMVGLAWALFALGLTPVRVLVTAALIGLLTPQRDLR